jgi:hypothetical protein
MISRVGLGVILLAVLLVLVSTGCSGVSTYQKSIYSDDTKISNSADSYYFGDRIGGIQDNKLSLTFGSFYGKQTIWTLQAEQKSTINLDLEISVEQGQFKVCSVNPDKQVSVISEGADNRNVSFDLPEGKSFIVIVGNNANGRINMIINTDENVKISS